MTVELQMLVYASLLSIVLAFPPLLALILDRGLAYAAGNRDEGVELPVWGERAQRAQWNLLANLPAFAALVRHARCYVCRLGRAAYRHGILRQLAA